MKSQPAALTALAAADDTDTAKAVAAPLSTAAANRILLSLMVPTMLMPLLSSMSRVALPIVRNDFQIAADMTAWVDAIFTLPFMFLMPVYGRLSDGVGRRRLILAGIAIFALGTSLTVSAQGLGWLMAGRAIQGVGTAGMMPLAMAMISTIFPSKERGKALGTWSSVGPTTAFVGPLLAGFLVEHYGWRAAFAAPLIVGVAAFVVVAQYVPAGLSKIQPHFWRSFDWLGVLLLAGATSMLLFFLSSRPITGVAPLQDWRLGSGMIVLFLFFWLWERRQRRPFVDLTLFQNRMFNLASFCGSLRMVVMAGQGFLIPLYLVDVHGVSPSKLGTITMISAGSMALIVRIAANWPTAGAAVGQLCWESVAKRSSWSALGCCRRNFAVGNRGDPRLLWPIGRPCFGGIASCCDWQNFECPNGAATGLYSMIRFAGAMVGTALCGVILQHYFDQGLVVVSAYQRAFSSWPRRGWPVHSLASHCTNPKLSQKG
ncbi:MAG: MFS transporter [Caldilineaceae bacterium]